jgi:hypothetical protein
MRARSATTHIGGLAKRVCNLAMRVARLAMRVGETTNPARNLFEQQIIKLFFNYITNLNSKQNENEFYENVIDAGRNTLHGGIESG